MSYGRTGRPDVGYVTSNLSASATNVNRLTEDSAPPFGEMPFLSRRESSTLGSLSRLDSITVAANQSLESPFSGAMAEDGFGASASMTVVPQNRREVQGSDRYGMGIRYSSASSLFGESGSSGATTTDSRAYSLTGEENVAPADSKRPSGRRGSSFFGAEVDRLMEEQQKNTFKADVSGRAGLRRQSTYGEL